MAANANAHFEPQMLSFLQDTSSIVQHRDSGNARALEKSGDLGKHYIILTPLQTNGDALQPPCKSRSKGT